jgi:hypothetical protein
MAKHGHDLLPFYVNGQLPTAERITLEQHLLSCQECRAALDEWRALANTVRRGAELRAANLPPLSPQLYRAQQEPATPMPSTSSRRKSFLRKWNIEEYVTIRRPSERMEEHDDMNATYDVSHVPARLLQFPGTRKLMFDPITWAATILVMIVLGILLLFMRASFNPGAGGAPEETIPEFAAQPEGCAVETADAQAESVRLAGEATALLQAEGDNSELAMLLGICALETAYSPEADEGLQRALDRAGHLPTIEMPEPYVNSAEFSPDGKYILTAGGDFSETNPSVRLWDAQTLEGVREFEGFVVSGHVFSPDGRYILTTDGEGMMSLSEAETGGLVRTFMGHQPGTWGAQNVVFSPDGRYILAAVGERVVHLFDVATGATVRVFAGGVPVAFSPDGRRVITGSEGSALQELDIETGDLARQFTGDTVVDTIWTVEFTSNSRYMLAGASEVAILWDYQTGEEIRLFSPQLPGIGAPILSPDGQLVFISSSSGWASQAHLWDVETGQQVRTFVVQASGYVGGNHPHTGSFSADGRRIVIPLDEQEFAAAVILDTDYRDFIATACTKVSRDFTPEERAQYGLSAGPACP